MKLCHNEVTRFLGRWFCILVVFVFWLPPASGAISFSARSYEENWIVYATSQEVADKALIRANRVRNVFLTSLGQRSVRSSIPIVFGLGDVVEERIFQNGNIQIFPTVTGLKIQGDWHSLPISPDSFDSGVVRALTLRIGLEKIPKKLRDKIQVSIPNWIPEGMGTLFSVEEGSQKFQGWSTLMARFEPLLSMDEVLLELEHQDRLEPMQQVMAGTLCRALIQNAETRERFLFSLYRSPELSSRAWLCKILGIQESDLDLWWKNVWRNESANLPMVRLGYISSQSCILEYEKNLQIISPEDENSSSLFFETVLNPWFRFWVTNQKENQANPEKRKISSQFYKDLELRRNLSLLWFEQYQSPLTKEDLILWKKEPLSGTHTFIKGSAQKWFDKIERY